jgi:hypothetical protein
MVRKDKGRARHSGQGAVRRGQGWLGSAQFGRSWCGRARRAVEAWYAMDGFGKEKAQFGTAVLAWLSAARLGGVGRDEG